MLTIARLGLLRRDLGEERFLIPLEKRLYNFKCPADRAADIFKDGGVEALVNKWKF